jgi:hypothetical protein
MTAILVACLFSAIVGVLIGWSARDLRVSQAGRPDFEQKYIRARTLYVRFRSLFDVYHRRARWAEMYAKQLEAELRIPASNRMTTRSWRFAHPNWKPFTLAKDE